MHVCLFASLERLKLNEGRAHFKYLQRHTNNPTDKYFFRKLINKYQFEKKKAIKLNTLEPISLFFFFFVCQSTAFSLGFSIKSDNC